MNGGPKGETPRTDEVMSTPCLTYAAHLEKLKALTALCRDLERELRAKTAELEACRADADRYRWLRDVHGIGLTRSDPPNEGNFGWYWGADADSFIDAARRGDDQET